MRGRPPPPRSLRARFILPVAAVCVGVLAVGLSTDAPAARTSGIVKLTAEYKGKYRFEDHFVSNSNPNLIVKSNTLETYEWDETLTEIVDASTGEVIQTRLILDATGHIHFDSNVVNPPSEDCDIKQLKVPKDIQSSINIQPYVKGDKVVGYGAGFNLPDTAGQQLRVTGNNNNCNIGNGAGVLLDSPSSTGLSSTLFNPSDPKTRKYISAFGALVQTLPFDKLPFSQKINASQQGQNAVEKASRSINAVVTLGGKAGPITAPPPTAQTTPKKIRLEVLADIRNELPPTIWWCGVAGAGTVLFLGGAPVIGVYIGTVLVGIAGPSCYSQIEILKSLARAADDPPVGNYARLASLRPTRIRAPLAACPAGAADFCAKLQPLVTNWRTATESVAGITRGLAVTVGRESAAAAAGNKSALKLQQDAGLAILPKLAAAVSSQSQAAKSVASLLRAQGISVSLDAARTAKTVASIKSKLKARGLPGRDVTLVTATAPTGPVDLLALLGAAAPKPVISSVTFSGGVRNPSLVIHGQNLGSKPAPNPAGSPSNQPPLCPVTIQGNAGLDYGTNLYINDNSRRLAAGRYRPGIGELDCIGLIVTKFTPTEVDYRLGSYYAQVYPQYVFTPGDSVEVGVNGATKNVHVKYGSTVTN